MAHNSIEVGSALQGTTLEEMKGSGVDDDEGVEAGSGLCLRVKHAWARVTSSQTECLNELYR